MKLVLQIVGERPAGLAETKVFDATGGVIGRNPDCDWALPDPDHHLSRRHCEIGFAGGRFIVTDTSSNGLFVNGAPEPLGPNNSHEIRDGDRLHLGSYEIEARVSADQGAGAEWPGLEAAGTGSAPGGLPDGPLDLDDLLGPGTFHPAKPPNWDENLDPARDGDPFGLHAPAGPPADDPFKDLDDLFPPSSGSPAGAGLSGPVEPDHVSSLNQAFPAPRVAANPIPEDWDLGLDPAAGQPARPPVASPPVAPPPVAPPVAPLAEPWPEPAAAPAEPPPPDPRNAGDQAIDLPEIDLPPPADAAQPVPDPIIPPEPASPAAVAPAAIPAAAAPSPLSAGVASDAALQAFLRGAGIDRLDGDPEAAMLAAGQVFRAMVAGLREVLQARSTLKNEFRLQRTVIRAAENNPLKFSVDADEAIASILQPRGRGYMAGPQAVEEGFRDLKVHQLAVMAGMQEALSALLAAFHPDTLAQRLDRESRFLGFLPGSGSRYWEAYEKRYREIAQEAESSFRGILGEAFGRAYEDSARKLGGSE